MRRPISAKPISALKKSLLSRALFAAAIFFAALSGSESPAASHRAKTEHVEIELVAEHGALAPGADNWVGLRFKIIPHWHIYWRNPGDSGLPTTVEWTLPPGVGAGEIEWPFPTRFPTPPLLNYGYAGEVLLPMRMHVEKTAAGDSVALVARASWLVCEEACIPEKAELRLVLPLRAAPGNPNAELAPAFDAARAAIPRPTGEGEARIALDSADLHFELKGEAFASLTAAPEIFPVTEGLVKYAAPATTARIPGGWRISLPKEDNFPEDTSSVRAVAVDREHGLAWEFVVALGHSASLDWVLKMMLFAFLGGAILNLMPCVFPVLAIKILSFVKQGQSSRRETLAHSGAYAAGVVVSFLAMGIALAAFRAAGEELGWGFQLQSPAFLFLLASLIYLMGLNLMGYFEFSGRFASFGDSLTRGGGKVASFFTGALAVVVATPCTAPFMGTAVGAAFTQPAPVMLLIFLALGIGMAFPYVLLSTSPGLIRLLPRPGQWMVTLKELLAFPLFATAIWLVWVLSLAAGETAAAAALVGMLCFTMAFWSAKRVKAPALRLLTFLAFVAAGLYFGIGVARSPLGSAGATASGSSGAAPGTLAWGVFSPEAVSAARSEGKSVFVNFTAAWCITCNVNERLVFRNSEVLTEVAARGIVVLKADWTNRDDTIAKALAEHGRAGVPLYLLYRPGDAKPEILPQILSPGIFLEAIRR